MKYLLVRLHLLPSPDPRGWGWVRPKQGAGSLTAHLLLVARLRPVTGFQCYSVLADITCITLLLACCPLCTVLLTLVTLREEARVWDKEIITII